MVGAETIDEMVDQIVARANARGSSFTRDEAIKAIDDDAEAGDDAMNFSDASARRVRRPRPSSPARRRAALTRATRDEGADAFAAGGALGRRLVGRQTLFPDRGRARV